MTLLLTTTISWSQNTTSLDFLKGKWISDSLNSSQHDHWREFVFIDSLGHFYRTTWWADNYVIDKQLNLSENQILKENEPYLSIEILDSNTIELTNLDYYGLFHRDPWPEIGTFNESLSRFIIGDSIKTQLTGTWYYDSSELVEPDPNFPQIYLDEQKKRTFLGASLDNLKIQFDRDNTFSVANDSLEVKYGYLIDNDGIDLSKSDYIINIKYKLNDKLELTESRHAIKRKLIFKRKK